MPPTVPQTQPIACDQCKSTYFYTVRAEEFQSGGYGTAEFRALSITPKTLHICIGCGKPVTPKPIYMAKGTQAALAEDRFVESMKNGQKFRESNSVQNFANIAASPDEVAELKRRIDDLQQALNTLSAPKPVRKTREDKTNANLGV